MADLETQIATFEGGRLFDVDPDYLFEVFSQRRTNFYQVMNRTGIADSSLALKLGDIKSYVPAGKYEFSSELSDDAIILYRHKANLNGVMLVADPDGSPIPDDIDFDLVLISVMLDVVRSKLFWASQKAKEAEVVR